MAHHKSAKKRVVSNATKAKRNSTYLSSVRKAVKTFRNSVTSGASTETVKGLMIKAQRLVDSANTKGMWHKNKSSRNISNMAKLFAKFEKGEIKSSASSSADTKKK